MREWGYQRAHEWDVMGKEIQTNNTDLIIKKHGLI
jgi:hypothetical protein